MDNTEVTESNEEKSLMDDLAAAWQESEETEAPEEPVAAAPEETPEESPQEEVPPDDVPRGTSEEPVVEQPETPETPEAPHTAPAAVREAWSDMPEGVRDAWVERDRQTAVKIQESAEQAKFAQATIRAIAPYQSALQLEAATPIEAIGQLAQSVTILRQGTPQEKANFAANLIHRYGVDITMLDNVLAGTIGGEQPQQQPQQPQEFRDPRVDQIMQDNETRAAMEANNEIKVFAEKAEFINDVRQDMADLLDLASRRGQNMTLQEAYDKACAMNPQVQSVLDQRKQADAEKAAQARNDAASSISGAPVSGGVATDESLRGSIEQAFADASY